ncbi:uncharacterized protein PFL1_02904 [Pseudozyma flocculosa PF-1]|nr:uncharacterized protein PFL1_02904 [Pseudozyma flocculosa PF-1]EPQ29684.1 hypothetical protein PFL1_02904 [Pseudozyma flocculosa PF-1]
MPKSGFDPQRHQRKTARHNPLGSKKGSQPSSAATVQATSAALQAIKEQTRKAAGNGASASPAEQIVPLLQNLPLPSAPKEQQASVNSGDKIWSLASVSLLLSPSSGHTLAEVKQNRKLLLSKDIVARLIHALQSDTNVEVRREASGALRNLCVDAGFDVRGEVANKGGVAAVLGAMRWAANALGFDVDGLSASPSKSSEQGSNEMFVDGAPSAAEELEKKRALLAKPIDKMNKKEKRHATRIAAAMGKSLEQVAGQTLSAEDEKVLGASDDAIAASASTNVNSASSSTGNSEPFIALDAETRKGLLEMSENLATITWCLCECGGNPFAKLVTWKWLDEDLVGAAAASEIPGQGLSAWLCGSIALGCRAASVLSVAGPDGARPSGSSDPIASLKNEELSLILDLALASANALCGLTDGGEADFVDGLLGRPSSSVKSDGAKKKGAKPLKPVVLPVVESLEQQAEGATKRLVQIDRAIVLLEACVQTDHTSLDKLKRYVLSQTTMLGVLASGALRNVAAAVDKTKASGGAFAGARKKKQAAFTSSNVFVPGRKDGEAALSLKRYEEAHILPALLQLLAAVDCTALARDLEGQGVVEPAQSDAGNNDGAQAKLQVRAEEKAQTLSLAIEILAEMASGFDLAKGGEADDEWQEDLDAEAASDEEMDEDVDVDIADGDTDNALAGETAADDGEGDDDDDDDDKMADEDTFAEAVKRGGGIRFESIAPTLCHLVLPTNGVPALADVLLPLARPFESSFPSLVSSTSASSGASSAQKQAPTLLRAIHLRSLSVLNNALLRLATFAAPPPSQPVSGLKEARRLAAFRSWLSGDAGAGSRLTTTFQALYEVARGCASVPAVANATPALSATHSIVEPLPSSVAASSTGNTEKQDGLQIVETCIGSMWSIARCLEGTVPLSWTAGSVVLPSSPGAESAELISALMASYHTASSDNMKVKAISLLATIARAANVSLPLNEKIAFFLLSILEAVPDRPTAAGSAASAESVVAAINGLVDTFADENSHYDVNFRRGDMLKRCRATVFKCRAVVKCIDRRRHLSLRAIAEEAAENWMAFVEYRQGLKL